MTDSSARPKRPQFGEYATPEEQRASIREPIDGQRAAELGVAPVVPLDGKPADASQSHGGENQSIAGQPSPDHTVTPERHPAGHNAPPVGPPVHLHPSAPAQFGPNGAAVPVKRGDRIATFVLLGVGLFNIIVTLPMLLDLPGAIRPAFIQLGIKGYSSDQLAQVLGLVALTVQVGLWIAALMLSSRALRAGRAAFWIPLVAGVVANVVVVGCLMISMISDPAFAAYFQATTGQ